MRPLEPPKKSRPRAKNILDRFKERWNRNSEEEICPDEDECGHCPEETTMIQEGVEVSYHLKVLNISSTSISSKRLV